MEYRFKHKPGDESCVFFGATSHESAIGTPPCQECKKKAIKVYNSCVSLGNELLRTSVGVDKNGKTFTKIGSLNEFSLIKPLAIKKVTERGKKHVETEQPKSEIDKSLEAVTPPKTEKKTVVRDGQAIGVLETAKKLLTDGKSYKEVLGTLIGIYMNVSREPKKAKHNAQSTMFNAMKRLGLKKANNDLGYEKI
jgi:hypothetical protein